MRKVSSIDDVNIALREIWGVLDNLRSKDLDMRKRRAVNASPSRDLYDYVVRKELQDIVGGPVALSQTKLYTIVFAMDGDLTTGDKASPPFIVQRPGIPILIAMSAVAPATTLPASINLKLNDIAMLSSNFELPITALSQEVFTSSAIVSGTTFSKFDILNVNVVDQGTPQSSKTTIEIFVKES